jgi:hypothetical protein
MKTSSRIAGSMSRSESGSKSVHSSPCSAVVKEAYNFIFAPPYLFVGWCLINAFKTEE